MKRIALFSLTAIFSLSLMGQMEEPEPTKHDATWHSLVLVDFKPGKTGDAKKIIEKYQSAAKSAGTDQPQQYWFSTGKYDMMLIWDMPNGPSDLEWDWSPRGVAWYNAMVKQEGSAEAVQMLQDDYSKLVAGSTSHIIRKDK